MPDNWRAGQVRNMGIVDGNQPASDNDWEEVAGGGDAAITNWINGQLTGRTCTVVLVGSDTANRKWINYEIAQSWNQGKGVVGIHVHGLRNSDNRISARGDNPFDYIAFGEQKLSAIVKCYNPQGTNSQDRYNWIKEHLSNAIEEAIRIRNAN